MIAAIETRFPRRDPNAERFSFADFNAEPPHTDARDLTASIPFPARCDLNCKNCAEICEKWRLDRFEIAAKIAARNRLPPPGFMSAAQVAKIYGVTPETVNNWRRAGRIEGKRENGRICYPAEQLKKFKRPNGNDRCKIEGLCSNDEAVKILRVARCRVRHMRTTGILKVAKIKGLAYFYRREDVVALSKTISRGRAYSREIKSLIRLVKGER